MLINNFFKVLIASKIVDRSVFEKILKITHKIGKCFRFQKYEIKKKNHEMILEVFNFLLNSQSYLIFI